MTHALFHTDIIQNHWIYRLTPRQIWPYLSLMRLDRPIGTWLLLLPSLWAIAMESHGITHMTGHHLYLISLFSIGAIIMRSAGCVINDLWDRNIDQMVERTKHRPIASGQISPRKGVFLTFILLGIGGLILFQLPSLVIYLGILSLFPVVLYPLAKRMTWYPQAVLGLTFNFGALMGAAAVTEQISFAAFLLYMAGVVWTLGYDTIYAYQDIIDDEIAGIKSTARRFQSSPFAYISGFYGLFATLVFGIGLTTHAQPLFYIFWGMGMLYWIGQMKSWVIEDPSSCLQKFRNNRYLGFLLLGAFLFGYIPLI